MITGKFISRLRVACTFVAGVTLTTSVSAGDKVLAESLFQEGKKLVAQGKYEEGCNKLAASHEQDPAPGTLLNLGKCHEAMGKLATAWIDYKQAEAMARTMGRDDQKTLAIDRAAALEPKLSRLRVSANPGSTPGLVVKRNGDRIPNASLGTAVPVDPGKYVIEASAPGYETWTKEIDVGKNADSASVEIPPLTKPAAPVSTPAATTSVDTTTVGRKSSNRTLGWVVTGAGGAAIVGGGILGLMVMSQASDAENDPSLCPNKTCTPAGREEIESARSKALVSTIAVGAGFVAVGAGVYLLVTSSKAGPQTGQEPRPRATIAPLSCPGGAGLAVEGLF
jgi:hypothetical protein